ncbi:MAG: hypothetical protein GKS07_10015 [Nitrosopumilus sp.]|nr:MAG: hypothetical protein GKS07_10015 [Nitrosopumilus sp.]
MTESEFTVLESYTRDVTRNVVRIDKNTMDDLSIDSGDTVEIMGKHRAVAKCLQLYPADEDKKIIRVNGLTRNNCKAEIGDTVSIRKINSSDADSVMVAPLETIPPLDPRYLADALEGVLIIPEQFILIPYFGGRLTFMVVGTIPEVTGDIGAVTVTQKTRFGILEKNHFLHGLRKTLKTDDITSYRKYGMWRTCQN